jgi:hypothetical protein
MPDRVLFSYTIIHQVPRRGVLGSLHQASGGGIMLTVESDAPPGKWVGRGKENTSCR